jgi:hypothetical protein
VGLSDEERLEKAYYGVDHIRAAVRKLKLHEKEERTVYDSTGSREELLRLCDQLWHALLGGDRNTLHWFMGSDSSQVIRDDGPYSPWAVSIRNRIEAEADKHWRGMNYVLDKGSDEPFSAFKGFLNISGLLAHVNRSGLYAETVFTIYQGTEHLAYAIRRYDDKFKQEFSKLDKLISDIQGVCFSIFNEDETYLRAYLIHESSKLIYGDEYYAYDDKKWDPLVKFLSTDCTHHILSSFMHEDERIYPLRKLVQINYDLAKALNRTRDAKTILFERVVATVELTRGLRSSNQEALLDSLKPVLSTSQMEKLRELIELRSRERDRVDKALETERRSSKYREVAPELSIYRSRNIDEKRSYPRRRLKKTR